jgi:hypothetical protein
MLAGYALMVAATVAVFLIVRHLGASLVAPQAAAGASGATGAAASNTLLRLLIALTTVIVTGQLLSRVLAFVGQPPVIGEVAAGILLGPSLIGTDLSAMILPPSIAPTLGVIAQLGVILYMFLVGLELHPGQIRQRLHLTVATSVASIAVPFVLALRSRSCCIRACRARMSPSRTLRSSWASRWPSRRFPSSRGS